MVCAASAVLPRVDRVIPEGQTGIDVHDFMCNLASMKPEEALERVPAASRQRCEELDLTGLPLGAGWRAEAAYAYDVVTEKARFIGFNIGREYGPRQSPSEMFLSIDTSAVIDGEAFAADWKTGRSRVTNAANNWQVRVAALVVARESGAERARGAVIYLPEGGTPRLDIAEWDEFDLATFASELRLLWSRIEKPENARPVMGDHCKWCPCLSACPAQGRLIAKLAANPEEVAAEALADLTPETAWRAYERLKAVRHVTKRVEEALYAYASQTPIQLPDGSVFGKVETEREELDAVAVRNVLAAMYGAPIAEKACDFETSKAAIERALRVVVEERKRGGQKTTLKALKDEALARIRELGGVTLKTRVEVKEYRPRAAIESAEAPALPEVANG